MSSIALPTVPSIATEYVRNRKQHDNNARHWTELYARPGVSPPPTSPPPSSVGPGLTGPSSRLFALPVLDPQRLFEAIQSRSRSRTSSVPPSQASTPSVTETTNDPILIESDSEDNPSGGSSRSGPTNRKRKREEPDNDSGRQDKRGRVESGSNVAGPSSNANDVIVIEDDD